MKTKWMLALTSPLLAGGLVMAQDLDRVEQRVVQESVLEGAGSAEERLTILAQRLGATNTVEGWLISLPEDVLFDFDKATLRPEATDTLDDVSDLYHLVGEPMVTVEGHADHIGSEDYNIELSDQRAKAVAQWLITEGGLDATKITAAALGEQVPRAPNTDPDGTDNPVGRQLNRRVDILFRVETEPTTVITPAPVERRVVVPAERRVVVPVEREVIVPAEREVVVPVPVEREVLVPAPVEVERRVIVPGAVEREVIVPEPPVAAPLPPPQRPVEPVPGILD